MNSFNLNQFIKIYFNLPKGCSIENPNLLNFVCKVFSVCDAYVSNKALKHIVESRRDKDCMDFKSIMHVIGSLNRVLVDPDVVFLNEKSINSIGLTKKINAGSTVNNVVILKYVYTYNHYEIITTYERDDRSVRKLINIKHLIK